MRIHLQISRIAARLLAWSLVLLPVAAIAQSYTPMYTPGVSVAWFAWCEPIGGGPPMEDCDVRVSSEPYWNTNGHFHNSNRPSSRISSETNGPWSTYLDLNTGASGYALFWLNPGQLTFFWEGENKLLAQAERLRFQPRDPGGVSTTTDYAVGYTDPPIYYVEPKPQWIHVGGRTQHGGNAYSHWMTSFAAYKIWYVALDFLAAHPEQGKIAVNDMALPFGGVFDIYFNWQPPHKTHYRGTAVDIRGNSEPYAVPDDVQEEFIALCHDPHGAIEYRIEDRGTPNQHMHCRWPVQ